MPTNFIVEFFDSARRSRSVVNVRVHGRVSPDLDEPGSPQGFCQIMRFVAEEIGQPTRVVLGRPGDDFYQSFESRSGSATVRFAPADLAESEIRTLPGVILPFELMVPVELLKNSEDDAVMILRLGAAANSLQAILLNHGAAPARPPLATSRDLVHTSVIAASYVREVQFILDGDSESRDRVWHLAELGVKAGRDMPWGSLGELKELLDKSHPMQRRAHDVRRQLGFHVLPGGFRTWLRARTSNQPVVLAVVEDPTRADVVFVASAQAVAEACRQPDDPAFFAAVSELAFTLPYLIEAMCAGLAIEHGMTQSQFLKFRVSACLTGPAKWDPRGPLKEG